MSAGSRAHREFWESRRDDEAVIEPRVLLAFVIALILALFFIVMALEDAPTASAHHTAQAAQTGTSGDRVTQVQQRLAAYGYSVAVDGQFGPQTAKAVRHFQKVNGLRVDGIAGPQTSRALGLNAPAAAIAPAVRVTPPQPAPAPPAPSAPIAGRCTQYEPLLTSLSPGWDVAHMSRIMYRESRCQPDARNRSGASGLLQIMPLHVPNLGPCGVSSASDLLDPAKNICSAAIVYRRAGGLSPWAQTR